MHSIIQEIEVGLKPIFVKVCSIKFHSSRSYAFSAEKMGWFLCSGSGKSNEKIKKKCSKNGRIQCQIKLSTSDKFKVSGRLCEQKEEGLKDGKLDKFFVKPFTFQELAAVTRNFRADHLLDEGGFGRVYKGRLESACQMTNGKKMTMKVNKLEKFEGVDFRRWQKKMHFLLTTLKVVYVLSTPYHEVDENSTVEELRKRSKWDNDDYICRGHILNG
ncbi:uncharacterized protein LOC141626405 [Silene latifolia]|uniref:uncharacterized protein LOC141626405 n=1 Tax=Silene latifolia TaxID=37657 RepID=UPI003D7827FC